MEYTHLKGSCVFNQTAWIDKQKSVCSNNTKYHCLVDQDKVFGELCATPIWIQPNLCPSFNTYSKKIDAYECDPKKGNCPVSSFLSSDMYKFSACLQSKNETPTSTTAPENNSDILTDLGIDTVPLILICAIIPLILIAVIIAVVICQRRKRQRNHNERPLSYRMSEIECLHQDGVELDPTTDEAYCQDTTAVKSGVKKLQKFHVLVYIGISGSGKTKAGLEIMASHARKISGSDQVVRKICRNFGNLENALQIKKTTFLLLDDWFKHLIQLRKNSELIEKNFYKFKDLYEKEIVKRKNIYLIFTIEINTWKRFLPWFEQCQAFNKKYVLDLSSIDCRLNLKERQCILENHAHSKGIEIMYQLEGGPTYPDTVILDQNKVNNIVKRETNHTIGFPETCDLYCRNISFFPDTEAFFNNPHKAIKNKIKEWGCNSSEYYCVLVYTLLKGGEINRSKIDDSLVTKIAKSCSRAPWRIESIRKASDTLLDKFLVAKGDTYRLQYDIITLSIMAAVGEINTQLLIEECDSRVLRQFIRTNTTSQRDQIIPEYVIPDESLRHLAERLAKVSYSDPSVFEHVCMDDQRIQRPYAEFRAKYLTQSVDTSHLVPTRSSEMNKP